MKIKRKTFDKLRRGILITSVVIIVCGVFYIFFRTSTFTITSYELIGVPEMYKERIESNLRVIASYPQYKILPSNRVLMYRSKAIKLSVVDVLPNSKTIKLRPVGLHTLRVTVTPYEPLFKIDEFRGITKEGVIYTEFKDMQMLPTIYIASTTSKEVIKDGIRSTVITGLESNKLVNISKLVSKIDSVIFKISKIEIDPYGDIILYNEGGVSKIIFAGDSDVDKVWSNLLSAIDTDPLKSKLENSKDKLEYLDARFGNKVFFKFTNGVKTDIIQIHASTTQSTSTSSR